MKKIDDFTVKRSNSFKNVYIIKPSVFNDKRGSLYTSYTKYFIHKLVSSNLDFKHDKFSLSKKNVLRGFHGDKKTWKLVTCVYGSIFQAIVDLDENSKTYLKYETFNLNHKNKISVLVPPYFGNAYCVLSKEAVYNYKLAYKGEYNDADKQINFKWNHSDINIKWPIKKPILSNRDR